jgi:sulfide:quinone oxidoreductase
MPRHIVIVGGGVGGTIVANLLAKHLKPVDAEVTVIESSGKHQYMPGWLYLPFNTLDEYSEQIMRRESDLLNRQIQHIQGKVIKIDPDQQELTVHYSEGLDEIVGTGGAKLAVYPYDYLVLATGARLAPYDLPGLIGTEGKGGWHHFYSAEGALELRKSLHQFEGGRIVIGVAGIPYRCPPAPLEFTFLLDEWLSRRGLRSRAEIEYLSPLPKVFTMANVADMVAPMLDARQIGYTVFFNAEAVDTERKVISSMEGEEVSYDLLILIPPHRGSQVIEMSGLGDEQGWIPTDRTTLQVKGHQHMYAIGDATDLPVSKSASAAHFEAKVVAHRLIAEIHGEEPDPEEGEYNGEVMCFLETGYNRATQLVFNYDHPPEPPRPSLYYHMEKQLFNRAYWHLVPQGLV